MINFYYFPNIKLPLSLFSAMLPHSKAFFIS